MSSETVGIPAPVRTHSRFNWFSISWILGMHLGAIAAPFFFSWSGLVVFAILYVVTGLGITLGYHRLLTHRGFETPKIIEYILTSFGILASQGSPLKWVATHRKHHQFSDEPGDPHTPEKGFWWSHMYWWMYYDPTLDDPVLGIRYVKDLHKDRIHRMLDKWQIIFPMILAAMLYGFGEWWGDVGISWLLWGMFARATFVFHATWLVNSASHIWGYRNFETKDHSRNLWWVALITFGEGWHNNHHAFQQSSRHGLKWWEFDPTYWCIRSMRLFGLARKIHVAKLPNQSAPLETVVNSH